VAAPLPTAVSHAALPTNRCRSFVGTAEAAAQNPPYHMQNRSTQFLEQIKPYEIDILKIMLLFIKLFFF
jgi:hypothetical protein